MKNVDRIITAQDYSRDEGADGTAIGRIKKMQHDQKKKGAIVDINYDVAGMPVIAQINQGAWIAQCECRGAEFVDPDEPVFFCWGCVNRGNDGRVRPVIFPPNVKAIEAELLKRKVNDLRGVTDKDRAFLATPTFIYVNEGKQLHFTRSWVAGETVDDLKKQNKDVEDRKKEIDVKKDVKHGI